MTVMVFGTFDILHLGHIHLFEQAKLHGDHLIAVVSSDHNAQKLTHKKLFHTQAQRLALLKHIDLIDEVVPGQEADPYEVIRQVSPDVIALGYDQQLFVDKLAGELEKAGINAEIVRLPELDTNQFASSNMRTYINTTT